MMFDVVIVGSGAGGGTAAYELTRQGLKVGLIERGPRFDPQSDYILNHLDWETRRDPLKEARDQEQSIDQRYLTPLEKSSEYNREPFDYLRVHGVGGSTLHYQGEAHRFPRHAFESRSLFGWGSDWPIGYDDLAPYYQKMETLLGVAGESGNPFKPARGAFPTPAHPLSEKSQIMAESALRAGMTLRPNTLALPSQSIDGRLPCQHSGACNYGCIFNAKSSVDQVLIPAAEKTGNLTLLDNTRVVDIALDQQGQVTGIRCLQGSHHFELGASAYVLAAGAIETPRILLHSTNSVHPNGLANAHDQIGRYFMETVMSFLSVRLASTITTYRGPPIDARIWDFNYPDDHKSGGFVLGIRGYLNPGNGPVGHALNTSGIGRAHQQRLRRSFGRELRLFGIAEQQPVASNRVFLSSEVDNIGVPRVKVHSAYSEQDINTIAQMNSRLLEWARATDTDYIGKPRSTVAVSSATHVGGTCRMGSTPENSVVDGFGKLHGQENVYITDGSILPTQGAGDSPSLTIQALALRTAEKIASDLKRPNQPLR